MEIKKQISKKKKKNLRYNKTKIKNIKKYILLIKILKKRNKK